MSNKNKALFMAAIILGIVTTTTFANVINGNDPLPSWNNTAIKQKIITFVKQVSDPTNPNFVKQENRVAIFNNEGTLWPDKPYFAQIGFVIKRLPVLVKAKPSLRSKMRIFPLNGKNGLPKALPPGANQLKMLAFSQIAFEDITQGQFITDAKQFVTRAKHPRFNHVYAELIYQPMKELITYLQANKFQVYVTSLSGSGFVRAYSEKYLGVPVQNVLGSNVNYAYKFRNGKPVFIRQNKILKPANIGVGKAINFEVQISRRPILVIGSNNNDLNTLLLAKGMTQPHLIMVLKHDDAKREYAYNQGTQVLQRAAKQLNWPVISMERDFKKIFSFERESQLVKKLVTQ